MSAQRWVSITRVVGTLSLPKTPMLASYVNPGMTDTLHLLNVFALDHVKEKVSYLKFWLGTAVVTGISLAGWLISSSDMAASSTVFFAVLGLVLLGLGIVLLHRRIEYRIRLIKDL